MRPGHWGDKENEIVTVVYVIMWLVVILLVFAVVIGE